jgi:hypothetical protein
MPLDYTSRNITAGATSPYIPLITNNPAFQVSIVPLDGRMEQKPNQKDDTRKQQEIKIGDTIRAEVVSKTKKKGEKVTGRVLQVEMTDGAATAFKIITQRGKEVLVDPTTASKIEVHGEPIPGGINTGTTLEHRTLLFEEWKMTHKVTR